MQVPAMQFVIVTIAIFYFLLGTQGAKTAWKSFGNYTASERGAIDKLRSVMEPELYQGYMKTDQYLIRWLRDQDLNLDRARAKLLRSLQWRKANRIDDVLEEDYSRILRQCPYDTTGRDKLGQPVVTAVIGSCPLRKLVISGDIDMVRRALYHVIEKAVAELHAAQAQGKEINKFIIIGSGFGFNLRDHACLNCFPLIGDALGIYEDHYPEYFVRIFFINIPRIMEGMLTFVQTFLSERTKAVLRFYGYNRDEWLPELLKFIPADQLDPQFGGTRKSANARANQVVARASSVPQS